ncbi:unnamed protein product [Rotaria socialis]|uniref:G-protein coupled receptors family 1 profile domain-containing protein n=1 Tax=Rotaria socialis TaxID=392032 RepID=A0A818ZKA2_9BILA|nr:unnamed protein product [Rotaria socialis]CAF3502687.1 unnamed protein product [Rotaria socialis]CAF3526762.1 unnamed protein product [Rotaria socialis]CAF3609934.1 unnamed protein product [Rotaria socialis]CAF3770582.1 unnamed protein product [Rotaria socialis]
MYASQLFLLNVTMKMSITNSSNLFISSSIIYSILIALCLSLIALITALGNIVVLLAFYCDNKLRTINDYFILNMAIADFLVGFFCIPFYIPFSITQSWPFGHLFCKIWVTIDDVATMASVINIVAISINRYWSIAYPISYRKYVRQHLVYIVMASVWCLSFINFAPGIWLLNLFYKENLIKNDTRNDCSGDYHNSFVYMLIAQFNYFIWPFILLCILNLLIMINIWKRTRKMSRLMSCNQSIKGKEENIVSSPLGGTSKDTEDDQNLSILSKHKINFIERCPSTIIEENQNIIEKITSNKTNLKFFNKHKNESSNNSRISSFIHRKSQHTKKTSNTEKKDIENKTVQSLPTVNLSRKRASVSQYVSHNYRNESITEYQIEIENDNDHDNQYENDLTKSNFNEIASTNRSKSKCRKHRQSRSRIIRDRKAARSLFILVIVFLIFLFPYVICATASTAGANVSTIIFEISFWLLWMNSTCNPFLYPFIQIKYRRAYLKLFQSCTKYFTFSRSNSYF